MDWRVELYYSKNGTVEIVSQDTSLPIFSFFITIFCFLCGVSHNLIVLSAVLTNTKLRNSSFHQMLALVSLTCLLDCLTNESVAVGLLINNVISWCSLSAVLFQLFLLLHSASLALFCVERTFTLYKLPLAIEMCVLGELSASLFGLLFSLPLSAASEVHYFRNRNSCGTLQHNSWAPALYLLGILLCWCCQGVYCAVAAHTIRQQQHQQTTFSPIPVSSPSAIQSSAPLPVDRVPRVCSNMLFLNVCLLAPQTVTVAITLFLRLDLEPDPWLDPRLPRDQELRSVATTDLELLLTYLRYIYNLAVPVLVLSSDPAVRLQARRIFCCSTNRVASDNSIVARIDVSPSTGQGAMKIPSFETPVLFSTPQGIHLRLAHNVTSSGDSIRLITQFCDLTDETECDFENGENSAGNNCRRNVRFSSKIEAFSLAGTTSGSDHVQRLSDTRTVSNPVLVRGETDTERTYTKF